MGKFIDLTGQKFGKLIVLRQNGYNKYGNAIFECKCDCGNITYVSSGNLRKGMTKSCGCYKAKLMKNGLKKPKKTIEKEAPWLLTFIDEEKKDEFKKRSVYSKEKFYPICPICGNKSDHKVSIASVFSIKGFDCWYCGKAKKSVGVRTMYAILEFLGLPFEREYQIEDGSLQKYDFYLDGLNIAIEIDGGLGHGHTSFLYSDYYAKHTRELDEYKNRISKKNGIKLIRINTKDLDFDEILNEIISSDLAMFIDLSNLDKATIFKEVYFRSLYKDVIDDFNSGITVDVLSKKYKLCEASVRKYLLDGTKRGICSYFPRCRPVICLTNGLCFKSVKDASIWCGTSNQSGISKVCRNLANTAGKHPETGEPLRWKYA